MATALSAANSCCSSRIQFFFNNNRSYNKNKQNLNIFKIRASSNEEEDCNVEECAPDKEVGKVSMEWVAGDKTKVAGTFPPRRREWSGYVEKDTAGQTNIYSVEPAVYVAETAISSGTSGTSAEGADNTAGLVGFGAIIAVAAASVVLLQVGKNPPPVQTLDYSGPSLSYYITKFKPSEIVQISVPTETAPSTQSENSTTQVEAGTLETESSAPSTDNSTTQVESGTVETEPSALSDTSTTQVDSGAPEIAASTSAEQSEITLPQVTEVQVESG